MAAQAIKYAGQLPGLRAEFAFAGRKFHAWWEGYAFDEAEERAAIIARFAGATASPRFAIAQSIWGEGRIEPGSPAWTMRFARMLSLPVKANVVVFGAGAGAVLSDLRHGTKWKVAGLTRIPEFCRGDLKSYDEMENLSKRGSSAGALAFFELSKDTDPAAFGRLAAGHLTPGSKVVFVDFAIVRRGAKLRSCFPTSTKQIPRTSEEYATALEGAGFSVLTEVDETAGFLPLIAQGWAGWRKAHSAITAIESPNDRAKLLAEMGAHAHLWAERFDALKSGQLRVVRIQTIRS